jgi:hypothetical protein
MPPPIDDPVLGQLTWRSGGSVLSGAVEDAVAGRITFAIVIQPFAGASEVVALARRSLQRFRAREGEYRRATAGSGHEYLRREKMAEVDVANSLLASDFIFHSDGSLRVYWGDPMVVTEIGPNGQFVGVWTH